MRSKQTICKYRNTIVTNTNAQIWQIQSLLERWTFTLALIHGRPPRALLGARIRGSAGLSWLPKPQVAREYKNQIQIHNLRNTLRKYVICYKYKHKAKLKYNKKSLTATGGSSDCCSQSSLLIFSWSNGVDGRNANHLTFLPTFFV